MTRTHKVGALPPPPLTPITFFEHPTATLLPNGRVLVAGGYSSHSRPTGEEIYDPETETWSYTSSLTRSRHYHSTTLLPDGNVLVAGGVDEGTDQITLPYNSTELYAPDPAAVLKPKISNASVSGKHLVVVGENFDVGAVILINGVEQRTKPFDERPQNVLIGKKSGKKLKAGDKIEVRNPNGLASEEFIFTGS